MLAVDPIPLAPLTKLMSIKNKCKWTNVQQDAFNKIKWIVAHGNLFTYPDFNEIFQIHIDSSAFQLGAVIIHKRKLIDLYCRNFTGAQQRYMVTKK